MASLKPRTLRNLPCEIRQLGIVHSLENPHKKLAKICLLQCKNYDFGLVLIKNELILPLLMGNLFQHKK